MNHNDLKEFNDFYIQRRFSRVFEMYPNDTINFKDYNSSKKIEITLYENDMLFIPAGWLHYVYSDKVNKELKLNIATSYFTKYQGCIDCDVLEDKVYTNTIKNETENVDYTSYAKQSEPFVIKKSKVQIKWTLDKLNDYFKNKMLIINKSKYKLFVSNYIKKYNEDCCQEINMTFEEFLKSKDDSANNYYLIQSENKNEIIPEIIKNEIYQNFSMWINFGNVYTNLHYDTHNNLLVQMKGTKKIILFPPSEKSKLHMINPLDTKFLCKLRQFFTRR